ncbi:zinc-binding alcohol dehydrogenase family protein [Rathayibacter sp. VKM Ac-2759]|uniref:zinc-binding alcohol dehydrogenase family protein n=1 Tax=Rathayibacter sp. VKM Ac-2759 TaxID=2609252 RepID=UPI001FC9E5E4|nr:zinc-binding alcohol dehydrogenase family protein [Rathayibacter sp. VKM Ac-2759]
MIGSALSGMAGWRSDRGRLTLSSMPLPEPVADELVVRVRACGLCRTDLHVIDQELPVHRRRVVPGHQVVGVVEEVGATATGYSRGDVVGVAWLRRTCGSCRWCRSGRENLCPGSVYTGWDADGGFAEYVSVPAAFAYRLPRDADPVTTAPLLCAGIIGFRALERANLPPGGRLGVYGFGSSAHITAQLAMAAGAEVFVMTRGEHHRAAAAALGVAYVGGERDAPPCPLDSAIVFAPSGPLLMAALAATDRGGTVVAAGIHLSDIPAMDYRNHLFQERDLRSVAANTRADGDTLLRLAGTLRLTPTVTRVPFRELERGIAELRSAAVGGTLVLTL